MTSNERSQLRQTKDVEDLWRRVYEHGENEIGRFARSVIEDRLETRKTESLEALSALPAKVAALEDQLMALRKTVARLDQPEWKKWSNWIALGALAVAIVALALH